MDGSRRWVSAFVSKLSPDGVCATDREAWVVGPSGTLLHTLDGGVERSSWPVVETGTTRPAGRIAAVAIAGGSLALATGAGLVLRHRSEQPAGSASSPTPSPATAQPARRQ